MPDWRQLVNEHLAALVLDPHDRAEVIEELAAHLDETFVDLRRRGLSEGDAARRCLSEVHDWRDLRRKIQIARRKEDPMTNRVKQLWLPGLVTFVLSMGFLALAQIFGPKPWILTWGHPPVALFYLPWLFSLPLVGAVGAYLSHRAGGSRRAIFSSIVFPVLPFLAVRLGARSWSRSPGRRSSGTAIFLAAPIVQPHGQQLSRRCAISDKTAAPPKSAAARSTTVQVAGSRYSPSKLGRPPRKFPAPTDSPSSDTAAASPAPCAACETATPPPARKRSSPQK